jgi:GT2 family glycosyltransferase
VAYRRQCLLEEQFREFLPGYTLAEDLELSLRISRRWDLVQTPAARLFHKRSAANRGGRGDRASRVVYSHFYIFHQHMPHDPSHLAAFAWANVGLVGLALGGAVKSGQVGPVLRGLAQGYRLCAQDLK